MKIKSEIEQMTENICDENRTRNASSASETPQSQTHCIPSTANPRTNQPGSHPSPFTHHETASWWWWWWLWMKNFPPAPRLCQPKMEMYFRIGKCKWINERKTDNRIKKSHYPFNNPSEWWGRRLEFFNHHQIDILLLSSLIYEPLHLLFAYGSMFVEAEDGSVQRIARMTPPVTLL